MELLLVSGGCLDGGGGGLDEVPGPPPDFATLYYLPRGEDFVGTELIFSL